MRDTEAANDVLRVSIAELVRYRSGVHLLASLLRLLEAA